MMEWSLKEIEAMGLGLSARADERPTWLRKRICSQDPSRDPLEIEAQTLYYRLFWEIARRCRPNKCLEIGTFLGFGAAHLALPNPEGEVVTVDLNPAAKAEAEGMNVPNLTAIHSDSAVYFGTLKEERFDLIYIDGNHTFNQAYGEYLSSRHVLRAGGIMFFDDLKIVDGEMEVFWDCVVDEKLRLDFLHHTGFGVVRKTYPLTPPSWDTIIETASSTIKRNRQELKDKGLKT